MKRKIKNISHEFTNEVKEDKQILVMSGPVGNGGYFYEGITAEKVRNALEGSEAKEIVIKLNSGGGDFFEGLEIKNILKDQDAKVVVEVMGLAASAASIICMGADEVIMRNGSSMMIHEASTIAYGNKNDIMKTVNALESIDGSIVEIYKSKTGLSEEEISEMIKAETWLTAKEAVEKGFADVEEKLEEEPETSEELKQLKSEIENMRNELKTLKENGKPEEKKVVASAKRRRFF